VPLPRGFALDMELPRALVASAPKDLSPAIELRDASWHTNAAYDALREHNVGLYVYLKHEGTGSSPRFAAQLLHILVKEGEVIHG
jgi:hypothetical protein